MNVQLIAITNYLREEGGTEALIEHAGRVCYKSAKGRDRSAFIRARMQEGHLSIVEHASATFEIDGISRACSHQLVRHRLASYSQESQRYVDMSDPEAVIPPDILDNEAALELWDSLMFATIAAYSGLREMGILKEDARFILPNATATRIVVTMNFRELLHFFEQRLDPAAQWEIRGVAYKMLSLVTPYAPSVFSRTLTEYAFCA